MRRSWVWLPVFLWLSACGFHFPGADGGLPPSLRRLQVHLMGSTLRAPVLVRALRRELVRAGGTVVHGQVAGVPGLVLTPEVFVAQVLAVDTSGRVSAYLLNYTLSFELLDGAGKVVLPLQPIKLQRAYSFNITNVLGEQRQQQYLERRMRRAALRKLLYILEAQGPAALAVRP